MVCTLRILVLVGLVVAVVAFASSGRAAAAEGGVQKPADLNRAITVTMKYLLYLPKDT